ncbi:histidine biosynthesis trifunctional protein [Ascodesmis nigricans]|uniref:Histidine biosynthesis trifunctional protein n=1 Tax=Ascodesmis nigricans TaxID=341454 RepID=A0A4S2N852_9PEZI|nr:histidine biosynthesis trifunctional protein [Ascodesmis nigricans]
MALPLLAAVDVSSSSSGLSPTQLSFIGHIYLETRPELFEKTLAYVVDNASLYDISVNATDISNLDDVITLLNAGAARVFATYEQLSALKGTVDDSRLVLLLKPEVHQREKIIDAIADTSVGVYAHKVSNIEFICGWLNEYGTDNRPPVYVSFASAPSLEDVCKIRKLAATPIVSSSDLTADPEGSSKLSVGEILMTGLVSDRPDKLISTIVVDEQGVALGLVYSSAESVKESLKTGTGVYQSRKRGLWYKGATSGAVQELVRIDVDCDQDCLRFVVRQKGAGFCHLETATCFGHYTGLPKLQQVLSARKDSAPAGSYTARLFSDEKLLRAKIMEEAEELCDAKTKQEIAFEAADLIYFALTRCVAAGVNLNDVEKSLDAKGRKVLRRKGDAKGKWAEKEGITVEQPSAKASAPAPAPKATSNERITMKRVDASAISPEELDAVLKRPIQKTSDIMGIVGPIVEEVKKRGDAALLDYAAKFDKATTLKSPVLKAPFAPELMKISDDVRQAIDVSFENIRKFHAAQKEDKALVVETMPGVICSRFVRPIEKVGLYVPGGTAVLPSTTLMLGVPAQVAGCKTIVIATPPRKDGTVTPEIVYVAHKVGAEAIVLAGGAQAVAALAYGTESVPKVDKILGPGNQFVTAGKMLVSNDTSAGVSIDMPAGPSEVLVIADSAANPAFVASDLLSQAEHGVDSQVILIAVDLSDEQLQAIEDELHNQAMKLPRVDIVRGAISHSVTLQTKTIEEAMRLSNVYAPEHLILQIRDASKHVDLVEHAGSVFIGPWTPESVGDYSAGVNHSLPTYGYARQYSGVNLGTYIKHITSSELTEEGLLNVGGAVETLAAVEELQAHKMAVTIRLADIKSRRQ